MAGLLCDVQLAPHPSALSTKYLCRSEWREQQGQITNDGRLMVGWIGRGPGLFWSKI